MPVNNGHRGNLFGCADLVNHLLFEDMKFLKIGAV